MDFYKIRIFYSCRIKTSNFKTKEYLEILLLNKNYKFIEDFINHYNPEQIEQFIEEKDDFTVWFITMLYIEDKKFDVFF